MNRQAWALFLATILLATTARAQTLTVRADGGVIHGYVTTLASPEWQGRRTLTPGFDRATEWAEARLREWGLRPAGDSGTFFQAVPIVGPRSDFAWLTGMPALVIDGRAFSFREGEFVVDPSSTAATDTTAEAVFAGYGISAPAKGLDEYAGIEVAGRIVFVLRGSPRDAPPEVTDFPSDPAPQTGPPQAWTDESADQEKVMTAYHKGAAAVVLCGADPAAGQGEPRQKAKVAASPFTRPFIVVTANDPRILRSVMLRDPLESLVGFVDRINRIRRAIQQKQPRTEMTGVRVRVKGYDSVTLYGESFGRNQSRNVLAKIDGSDPVLGRQAVVIGAHLDHLGFRSGLIHPGADDNASGSAVVLEVARMFAASGLQPRRTVIFALWCGEEDGHHGSKRFTEAPPAGLTIDRIVGYINMDMVGLGTGVEAAGARDFPAVFSVMMRDQLPDVARIVKGEVVGPGGSDYAPFIAHGVDAISLDSIGGNGHPDYHDAADVASKIQPALLGTVGQFVLQAAFNLANETKTPLPVPGRRESCDSLRFVVPDIGGESPAGWRTVPARTPREMQFVVVQAIGELKKKREAGAAAGEPPPRIFVGAKAAAVAGNLALLDVASAALGVARLDLEGDDGAWVQGGLSAAGKSAVKAVEQMGITPNLVRPTAALVADVLMVASKPVLVSGMAAPDRDLAAQVKARGGAFVLECEHGRVSACATNLQALRTALGGSANLLVSMRAEGAAVQAHRALYVELASKGWSKDEIFAVAGLTPDGRPGGNIGRFSEK